MKSNPFTSVILTQERKAKFENEYGVLPKDWKQIIYAMRTNIISYRYFNGESERPISRGEAIGLLGEDSFLSGIVRSVFHWTATRKVKGTSYRQYVRFEASKMLIH